MQRWMKRLRWGCTAMLLLTGLGFALIYWRSRGVPEFYSRAVARTLPEPGRLRRELQDQIQEATRAARDDGRWELEITADQVNAWLIHELPSEYAALIPKGVEDPRVLIENGRVLFATRYKSSAMDTVISVEVSLTLTDEPNVVAVDVHQVRAGLLPIPIRSVEQRVSAHAQRGKLEIRWDHDGEVPRGLVTVPRDHQRYIVRPVVIDSLEVLEGSVRLAGRSGEDAQQVYHRHQAESQLATRSIHQR
jgi:hypothetical protein